MAADERSMPFIKNLASSDRKIRTSALETLTTFLRASTTSRNLTDLENQKLWKGLFFSLWMADRPIPQQNLCADLAALIDVLPAEAVIPFLRGFWAIMSKEWTGIDALRMNKFLLLVRRVLAASLEWTRKDWEGRSEGMVGLLAEWPLDPQDLSRVPVGLRLHVLDIWVDEAERAGILEEGEGEEGINKEASTFLNGVRELLQVLSKQSPSKPVKTRAKDSLADERLPWNESSPEADEANKNGDGGSWDGFDD